LPVSVTMPPTTGTQALPAVFIAAVPLKSTCEFGA
jgi:hypothetical protein